MFLPMIISLLLTCSKPGVLKVRLAELVNLARETLQFEHCFCNISRLAYL